MSKSRLALVANNVHFRGGMERYCAELVHRLCDEYDVNIFAIEVDDVPKDKVNIHLVPCAKRPIFLLVAQFYANSSRMVNYKDYDIVHTIGGITARQTFVTAQYCQAGWGDTIRREPVLADEGITAYHRFMWRFSGYLERRAVNSPDTRHISACSQKTKDELHKFYGTDPSKITVIHNAVDPVRFNPENTRYRSEIRKKYGLDEKAIVVLFVGEYRRKGLATVIRALGLIKDPNVYLLAVGKGDRPAYQAIAQTAGVADRVILADPERQIERVFGAADIFAFPTFYEPFGMVITEAMATGLPVITSIYAGASEVIQDGTNGLLVQKPSDPEEMAKQLRLLIGDASLRRSVGDLGRQTAASHDWDTVARETMRLYREHSGTPEPLIAGTRGK